MDIFPGFGYREFMKSRLEILGWILILISAAISGFSCENDKLADQQTVYTYKIINQFPHDPNAFTQGLVFDDGFLYEGTGQYRRSQLRKVDLKTGRILQTHNLAGKYFGEGICIVGDKIIQLTWKSRTGFVYDKNTFKVLHQFHYPTQGWGITYNGENLILSDGSSMLYFLDSQTFTEVKRIKVTSGNTAITRLNELEYIDGKIFANIWTEDKIVIIDPANGNVTAWINLAGIWDRGKALENYVLNGIAFDKQNQRLFVTGKCWPTLFEIKLIGQ